MTAPYVRPDVGLFLDHFNRSKGPRIHEVSIEQARQMVRDLTLLADAPAERVAIVRDLVASGPDGEIPLRLFDARETREPGPVLIYFHGGGWVTGDLDVYGPLCTTLAVKLDLPVVAVHYRRAPEHRWPAAPADCEAAARWIADGNAIAATGIILAGDSAGGNLAVVTAMALRDAPPPLPVIAQWLAYPVVDIASRYPSFREFGSGYFIDAEQLAWYSDAYQPGLRSPRALPLRSSQAGMPPTVVLVAGLDPLRDQGHAYADACIAGGVVTTTIEAEGNIHGFLTLRRAIPSSVEDLDKAISKLQATIADHIEERA